MEINIPNVRKMADFGPEEPFAARIWLTFPDLVKHMEVDATYEEIVFSFSRVIEELAIARVHLATIEAEGFGEKPSLDIQREYNAFYNAIWTAYKDRFQNYMRLMGYDIGFFFVSEKDFEKKAMDFADSHKNKTKVIEKSKAARSSWQKHLADYRNNRHTGDRREETVEMESPEMARWIFDRVWQDIEDIFIYLCEEKMRHPWVIREIPEKDRDPVAPTRFVPYLRKEVIENFNRQTATDGK